LAAIGSQFVYAIGSRLYNTSKTCEVYSVDNNEWKEQPELNRNRYLSTAVTLGERYIYVLGGYEPMVTDIERLDTF
jgi:N-acetylneuraminic acid mutarotase